MKMNEIFSDGLIFQANKPVRVFGSGAGTVTVSIGGKTATVVSSEDRWLVELPSFDYGGPYTLVANLNDTEETIEDVWFGDVYLAAGQSNMQLKLDETNTSKEYYCSNDSLRLFSTDRVFEDEDYFHARDKWVRADKETVAHWTALGYLCAKFSHEKTGHKVGVITCYQGAAIVQSWLPKGILLGTPCEPAAEEFSVDKRVQDYLAWNRDGNLYTAQFCTLVPFSMKAVLWYQGEGNTREPDGHYYEGMLQMLIQQWRKDLQDEKLPFLVIQLADLFHPEVDRPLWCEVKQAQQNVANRLSDVYLVKCDDICENDNIHPQTKLHLAQRMTEVLLKL